MGLVLTEFRMATVGDLYRYKHQAFRLPAFPGYTDDQWGIKAHNRPWVVERGAFTNDQRVIEVGGAFSSLPAYLARKYGLEAWVGDDFGASEGKAALWARWGDPAGLREQWPEVRYVLKPFGVFEPAYPDGYFDRVFSISTLEHIPSNSVAAVLNDMHRVLRRGGRELHSVDIGCCSLRGALLSSALERLLVRTHASLPTRFISRTWQWLHALRESGVDTSRITGRNYPYCHQLLSRETLCESYDVVYRFYPPNDEPKGYQPAASLLIVIDDV